MINDDDLARATKQLRDKTWAMNIAHMAKVLEHTLVEMEPVAKELTIDVLVGSFCDGYFHPFSSVQDLPATETDVGPKLPNGREDLIAHIPVNKKDTLSVRWDAEKHLLHVRMLDHNKAEVEFIIPPDSVIMVYDRADVVNDGFDRLRWWFPMLNPTDIHSRSILADGGQFLGYRCPWAGDAKIAAYRTLDLDEGVFPLEGVEHTPYEPEPEPEVSGFKVPAPKTLQ